MRSPATPESLVYVVKAGDLVKIGFTVDVPKRLGTLQNGNGVVLELLGTMPGGQEQERLLHEMFTHRRQQGEWFRLNESDLLALLNLLDRPEVPAAVKRRPPHESRWERDERRHRCKATFEEQGLPLRCYLWNGHGGDHETSAGGSGWSWDNRNGGPPRELEVAERLAREEGQGSSRWKETYEYLLRWDSDESSKP